MLAPTVFRASGLLKEPLWVNQTPMVGSVEPSACGQFVIGFRLLNGQDGGSQIRPRVDASFRKSSRPSRSSRKSNVPSISNAIDRTAVIEQSEKVDLICT